MRSGRASLVIAVAALAIIWSFVLPLGAGADEQAGYIKAVGTASGHLRGRPADFHENGINLSQAQSRYFDTASRRFSIPARLAPREPTVPCFAFRPDISAACQRTDQHAPTEDVSYIGNYQPVYYVVPGLLARLGGSPSSGLRLARLGSLLLIAILIWIAVSSTPSVTGVLLAATPAVMALAGSLTASNFEIFSELAFATSIFLLAWRRGGSQASAMAAVSGIALAWSRPLGPIWVAETVAVAAIGAGPQTVALLRQHVRLIVVLLLAAGGSIAWDVAVGLRSAASPGVRASISAGLRSLPRLFHQQVGVFSWLDTGTGEWLTWLWAAAIVIVILVALARGNTWERLAVIASALLFLASVVIVQYTTSGVGFATQGRYTLAPLILACVTAGTVAGDRRLIGPVAALFVLGELVGLYDAGRRFAVGADGRHWFFLHPQWSPPGTWWLWLTLAAVALAVAARSALISTEV